MVDSFLRTIRPNLSYSELNKNTQSPKRAFRVRFTDKAISSKSLAHLNITASHSIISAPSQDLNTSYKPSKLPKDLHPKPKQVWISKSKSGLEVAKEREKELINYITPVANPNGTLGFSLNSSKLLAEIVALRELFLPIPETLVYGYGFESPTLLLNDSKGNVRVVSNLKNSNLEALLMILSKKRLVSMNIIGPLAIGKSLNSQFNKIFMRTTDLQGDIKNMHKSDMLLQRYIMPKGNICSKYRVILRNDEVKVFKITNKCRFDKTSYEKLSKSQQTKNDKLIVLKPNELTKRLSGRERSSNMLLKEIKYTSLEDFMKSIMFEDIPEDLQTLYFQATKPSSKPNEIIEYFSEETISPKIFSKLRNMFCTESRNPKNSTVVELKSPKILGKLLTLFNYFKETISYTHLIANHMKLTELICDFTEDFEKNLYFLQLKHYKCASNVYVPLKTIKRSKAFKCKGRKCNESVAINQPELFARSILLPSKTVLPSKCRVLYGTILLENPESKNSFQYLNPRFFERVRVCTTCFQFYNRNNSKSSQ